ncbi:endonuclease/exonuclease/phosphatase family protein [Flavimaricola marinus]|uniref:Endonuclease/exonuclease/phosphatase domain-containing protein n=1 Tax=Flavimaricola marinus TaxID=1819565 RepID=A0A238L8X9_9RHOB|nr:endonuclease/exonuclease/phosphatase family protein [Flavimaricola marinus]SMY06033.1 hypothetical protein LOM8899_00154 [Flavimaricola marinus]
MRIATFNVENLFDRVRAFNDPDPDTHKDVLKAHSALNQLFEKPVYTEADKAEMLTLMGKLGILRSDEGPFVWLRRIRGKLITRPRRSAPRIVATGRGDWVGWCELKTARVKEEAITMTARVIRDMNADVLAVVEVESRPVLTEFHDKIYVDLPALPYRHMMVIDGNDRRGIDVGLMAREGFTLPSMRSHVDELGQNGEPVFSRDCPEYLLTTPGGERMAILPNHFKSKFGGDQARSDARRQEQAEMTASYYARLLSEGIENIIVLGDFNDTPASAPLSPIFETSLKEVKQHPAFTDFTFDANTGHRGIGTFGTGADSLEIDHIMLSPALWSKVQLGGIFRKGAWTASNRWPMYPELTRESYAASDHHGVWVDLDLD